MEIVLEQKLPFASQVELVEHKGPGHPDSICDALAEALSVRLSRFYLERFGAVLHHNVDKALLRGGQARPAFGGGEVIAPIELYLCGRAVVADRGEPLPIEELAIEGSRTWLQEHLHALDAVRHVSIHTLLRPGSPDLVGLFDRGPHSQRPLANDTSIGVGFAPGTLLERVVLHAAKRLGELTHRHPELGEDIKVMGVRQGQALHLTVACAFVGAHLKNAAEYLERKAFLAQELTASASAEAGQSVTVEVNAADDPSRGKLYLTVTGTSAEGGDDGEVGRGNRVNGLITPYRPMSLEAAAGKNPISHVGKLYGVVAQQLAADLVRTVPGVQEAVVRMVSCIGRPIEDPRVVHVELALAEGNVAQIHRAVEERVRLQLAGLSELTWRILEGAVRLF
jgi:S-adenosylmethionine synthetase